MGTLIAPGPTAPHPPGTVGEWLLLAAAVLVAVTVVVWKDRRNR